VNRIHQMTAKAIATPQHPLPVTANSDAEEALRRAQGRPAPIRPPAPRQTSHALTALANMTPGRRRLIAACAEAYLAQVDRRVLPMGYDQPIFTDAGNRGDAYRMRRGEQFAQMLGISCRPANADLPATARAVLAAIDSPVRNLTAAAVESGDPIGVAVAYLVASTIHSQGSRPLAVAA
jgi:hypothetical protein